VAADAVLPQDRLDIAREINSRRLRRGATRNKAHAEYCSKDG
jgi:hypothetical protein